MMKRLLPDIKARDQVAGPRLPGRPAGQGSLTRTKMLLIVATIVIVILAGTLVYVLVRPTTPATGQEELNNIRSKVSQHFLLPQDEEPALATVTDKTKLTTKFFKVSENGDKILIYQKNSMAIIYRPKLDRIVAVGPVDIGTPPPDQKDGAQ